MPSLPSSYNEIAVRGYEPTIFDDLPAEVRNSMFDPHFAGAHKGSPIPVRLTQDMERAMDILLQHVQQKGGIDWLETRADLMRLGVYVIMALLNGVLPDPPPELGAILTMDRIQAKAKMMSMMGEKLSSAMVIRSKQVADMMRDPDADAEVALLLQDLVNEVDQLRGYWQAKWIREGTKDPTLRLAMEKYNITFTKEETCPQL